MRFHIIHDWSKWTQIEAAEISVNAFRSTRVTTQMQERVCNVCGRQEYRAARA